jgi:hypothetical protein
VGRDEALEAEARQAREHVAEQDDELGVHVRLRLVPEERALLDQRAVDQQVGDHGELAEPLGDERRLHVAVLHRDVELAVGHVHLAAQRRLDRLEQQPALLLARP